MKSLTRWWFVLTAAALLALACFAIPMYVIRPFRTQGARELAAALAVIRIRPLLSVCAVLAAFAAAIPLWKSYSGLGKRLLVSQGVVVALVFGVLSWINVYEIMFHGAGSPEFVSAKDAKLEADEMVLAVNVNGVARAYPVGYIAYHHIINDRIGKVVIVATY
jgi:hypothetical protein